MNFTIGDVVNKAIELFPKKHFQVTIYDKVIEGRHRYIIDTWELTGSQRFVGNTPNELREQVNTYSASSSGEKGDASPYCDSAKERGEHLSPEEFRKVFEIEP